MSLRPIPFAVFAVVLFVGGEVRAQVLPPPRAVPPAILPPLVVLPPAGRPVPTLPLAALPYPAPGYQASAYQVWQNYGVNRNGWMVPRVWQFGSDGYWLYNGAPYPYVYTAPGQHFPAVGPSGPP
jgi:hypothetical protein